MKYLLIAAHCLLLSASPLIAAQNPTPPDTPGKLDWSIMQTWKMETAPLEFVQSLDNKKVFVLGADRSILQTAPNWAPFRSTKTRPTSILPQGERRCT